MATRRERTLQAAEKLVKKGRLEAAIEEFRKVLKESPDDTRTLNRVGDLYARLNRVDEAVELFAQAAERFSSEGFFVKAIAIYKKILRLDPTRMPIYQSLAELYQQQGLATEARAQYQVIADYYENTGDTAAMISVWQKLVELDPKEHETRIQFADLLAEAGREEEALEQYREVAGARLEAGEAEKALSVLTRAVEAFPENLQFVMRTVVELQAGEGSELPERFVAEAETRNPEARQARELLDNAEPAVEPAPLRERAEQPSAPAAPELPEPAPEPPAALEEPDTPAGEAAPPAAAAEPPAPALESDEFEIELGSFEAMASDSEPAAGEAEPPPVPSPPPAEDVEEILAEADALASYGLDEKAIDRLERALELEPGHLGAYRRLIGIQLNARRDGQVVRLAAAAASAALESGNTAVWRRIVGDLQGRGFRIEGSKVLPPPPRPVAEAPEELWVDETEEAAAEPESDAETAPEAPPEPASPTAVQTVEPLQPPGEEVAPEAPVAPAPADPSASGDESAFFDLGAELEQELGGDEDLVVESAGLESQSLEEIVEGFKQGMAEVLSPEAYDTHYNLGIAYREMGLVDEAIGEFQLAAKDPRYLVECCSLLGQCFQEKEFSDLALKWYRKGLESPAITEEETLGLLYEMGNLHLADGDREAALGAFTEIYGANSNFRDVVAKLEELRRSQ